MTCIYYVMFLFLSWLHVGQVSLKYYSSGRWGVILVLTYLILTGCISFHFSSFLFPISLFARFLWHPSSSIVLSLIESGPIISSLVSSHQSLVTCLTKRCPEVLRFSPLLAAHHNLRRWRFTLTTTYLPFVGGKAKIRAVICVSLPWQWRVPYCRKGGVDCNCYTRFGFVLWVLVSE